MSQRPLCSAAHTAVLIDVDKGIRPCCAYEGNHLPNSPSVARLGERRLADILATPPWTTVRDQLAAGQVPKGCVACLERERVGGWSQRLVLEKRRSPHWQRGITYLELSSSNLCNLQCRHCGPLFSSRWAAHEQRLGRAGAPVVPPDGELLLHNLRSIDLQHLEYVVVKGGEPMLNSDFAVLLDHLEAIGVFGNVVVDMVTNGTVLDRALLDRLARCRALRVCLSIDGHGPVQTYVRHGPSALERIEAVLAAYAAMPNVTLTRNTSVMVYNVFCLDRIDAWWDGLAQRHPGRYLTPEYGLFVLWPEELALACLQDHTRQALVGKYTRLDARRYAPVVRMLQQPFAGAARHDAFVAWTRRLDRELGCSVLDAVPELAAEMYWLEPDGAAARAALAPPADAAARLRAAVEAQAQQERLAALRAALALAWQAVERGDLATAGTVAAGLQPQAPDEQAAVLHVRAAVAGYGGDVAAAFRLLDEACALLPANLTLQWDRARALEALGRRDEAFTAVLPVCGDPVLWQAAAALRERCRPGPVPLQP
jgi:uncharacterized Fe-S cluster-containing radical SAM superfamily protein